MAKTEAVSKQNYTAFRYDEETARQIVFLSQRWGQPKPNVSAIILRCIEWVYQQEQDSDKPIPRKRKEPKQEQ